MASASLASKQETGHRALLQLFEPQFTASLANIDSKAEFTSEALPPDAVLVSVSHKPKSPRTRARLLAHLLLRLISSIHTDKRLEWSWLDRKAASDQTEQAQDLGRVATATFSLAHTTEHSGLRFALFNALFTHVLQSDSLAFLASVWIEPVHLQSGVALMALRDANVLVESSTADQAPLLLQHLLPTILVPLSHDDRSLREAALQLLTNMHQAGKKASATATPYGQSSLYGARTAGT